MSTFFVHSSAFIDDGCEIGESVKIWHFCHIMSGCKIGDGCNIGQNVMISSKVVLGKNVRVQNNVSIYEGVICEDDVFLGPSMVFTNVVNPRSMVSRKHQYKETWVRKGATIGANATIICGNEIGQYAFHRSWCELTKSIPSYALVVGNPAKRIGWMSEYGNRLHFNEFGEALCLESKEKYRLLDNRVFKIN